jgi:hypothetical protein
MGADEHFALGWYLTQESERLGKSSALAAGYTLRTGMPHDPKRGGRPEHIDDLLIRTLDSSPPNANVLFFSYFPEVNSDTRDTLASIRQLRSDKTQTTKRYEKWAVAQLWELRNVR